MTDFERERGKSVAVAACIALVFVGITPGLDAMLGALPWQPSNLRWRFVTVQSLAPSMILQCLALGLLALLCRALDWSLAARAVAVYAGLVGFLGLVLMGMLTLDSLQLRQAIPADSKSSFKMAIIRTALQITTGSLIMLYQSYAGWRAASRRGGPRSGRDEGVVLVRGRL